VKTTIVPQQTAFFTQHGYIEFEFDLTNILPLVSTQQRDLWRKNSVLKEFLIRKMGPIALALSGKKQLRLALDQGMHPEGMPKKATALKDLLSIQGLKIGLVIAENPVRAAKISPLGLSPLPTTSHHVLFFRPDILLDFPSISSNLYFAFFCLPNAVYIHNKKDPLTNYLKDLGLNFGDVLKNETHPLLF